jgi:hypothetical protein
MSNHKTIPVTVMSFGLEPSEEWDKVEALSQKILALTMDIENAPTANHALSALTLTLAFLMATIETSKASDKTLYEVIASNKEAITNVLATIQEDMGSREEAVIELVSSFSSGTTKTPELHDKPETVH